MLRAIAVLMTMLGCMFAGLRAAERLRRRSTVLEEIRADMQRIRLGLTHTNRPVTALLSDCAGRETRETFLRMARDIEAGETPLAAWEHALAQTVGTLSVLTENDRRTLTVFFSLFGGSDRYSQIRHADAAERSLALQCEEARHIYEKNGRIFRTMGVLLGAGVAILLM